MKNIIQKLLSGGITPFLVITACLILNTDYLSLHAQSIIYVNHAATGANDGTSWTDAYTDLQAALDAATKGDQIWVAEGTYKPSKDKSGNGSPTDNRTKTFQLTDSIFLYGGFDGSESALDERDWKTNETILSGDIGTQDDNSDNSYYVVKGIKNGYLDGFIIEGGNANGSNPYDMGGGIQIGDPDGGTPPPVRLKNMKVIHCLFRNNRANQGGGAAAFYCGDSIVFRYCTFIGDTADSGGGLGNWDTRAYVTQCTFLNNAATNPVNGYGGAIYNWGVGSNSVMTNCTFYKNFAYLGGSIHNRDVTSTCTNSILWKNEGGEISNTISGTCLVSYCDIDQDAFSSGAGCIDEDPLLYVFGTDDYRIHKSSPCIDAGNPSSPLDPDGSNADMGARWTIYEPGVDMLVFEINSPPKEFTIGENEVSVTLTNRGTTTVTSSDIGWEIDGALQTTKPWTGNLDSLENSDPIVLGTFDFAFGDHVIKAWTENTSPGPDEYPQNDTCTISVTALTNLDAGIISVVEPPNPFTYGLRDVRVVFKNYSEDSIITAVTIGFEIDGTPQTDYNWAGSLLPGTMSDTIKILDDYNFTQALHTIKVWTSDPNSNDDSDNTNDTLEVSVNGCNPIQACTKTIGATGDFATFTDAVNFLTGSCGIEGPVVFMVESDTYNEHILIPAIPGTSEINTITFQSASGDSNDVILTYSAGDYTVRLQQAEYIVFKNMTLSSNNGHVITLHNSATHNSYLNNRVIGVEGGSALIANTWDNVYPVPADQPRGYYGYNTFSNNLMQYGSHGIKLDCFSESKDIQITGNIFENHQQQAIRLDEAMGAVISNNTITSNSVITGIYLYYCEDNFIIEKNNISLMAGGTAIAMDGGHNYTGIPDHIANNFIHVNASGNHYGIYMNNLSARTMHILHNSINITGSSSTSYAVNGNTTAWSMVYLNNIFSNIAGGNTLSYFGSNTTSDYNCYFSNGTYLVYNKKTLIEHQNQYNQDMHSFSLDPRFLSDNDLHTFNPYLNNQGTPVSGISVDIDEEVRDAEHPDIGADEYTPLPPLSGTYDIGPSAPLFADFNEAVDSLIEVGVGGPVIFEVEDGTYDEQVVIPWISGANETNTITFKSASNDSTKVTLTHAATGDTDNYTLKLNGARYITFQDMTFEATGAEYARIVEIGNQTYNNSFNNNQFLGVLNKSELIYSYFYAYAGLDSCNHFYNNLFQNGIEGIHMEGVSGINTGLEIVDNIFHDQTSKAISLSRYTGPVIKSNIIHSEYKITGVYLYYMYEHVIIGNNLIHLNAGGTGIEMEHGNWGTLNDTSLIYNNHIYLEEDPTYGIYLNYNSLGSKIVFNTIHLTGNNASGACFYATQNEYKCLKNNIMVNKASGKVLYLESLGVLISDYNNLYTNGTHFAKYSTDLKDWQQDYGRDLNSFSVDPYFEADSSYRPLNPYLKGAGTPVLPVLTDIDGEPRDAVHPDIGADEFNVCSSPIHGTFTIGGVTPDYPNLYEAVRKLVCCGVDGPVTFNIATDTIDGQISIQEIPGASETNTITFQSASGDSTDVLITFTPINAALTYTLQLNGADYVTFKSLSFTSGEQGGHPIELTNMATHNQFLNNRIYYVGTMAENDDYALIYSKGSLDSNNVFDSNLFENGSIGILMNGSGTADSISGTQIKNNFFNGMIRRGVYLTNHEDFIVSGNQFSISTSGFNFGICVVNSKGLIYNNFVRLETTNYGRGIFLSGSDYSVYHNTVKITGNAPSYGDALWFSGNNTRLVNNVFTNMAGGRAMRCDTTGLISDYNLLYTSGSILITKYTEGFNYSDLSQWQDATGRDIHSISREPVFVSDTNLHTTDPWLNNIGTPLAEVTTDIDGESRDPSHPDIGADEFAGIMPFAGEYTIGPTGDFASFTDAVDTIAPVGIKGPVTFIVESGTYNEQFVIPEIPETSETNIVTFKSASGDSTDVILGFKATISENYTVKLDGAKYITFQDMTIKALDTAYTRVFEFAGGASNNVITNNIIVGRGTKNATIFSIGSNDNNNVFENNLISGGKVGIQMIGESSVSRETGTQIMFNIFDNQINTPLYLENQDVPLVLNNRIVHGKLNETDWIGIYLKEVYGQWDTLGLIANNLVHVYTNSTAYGISINNSKYLRFYYNSIHITGDADESRALHHESGNNIHLTNNIFSNIAGGLALVTYNVGGLTNDYNDLYTDGNRFIYTDNFINDLQTWQNTYGKDPHSFSVDPMFYADTNLHVYQPLLNGSGIPLAVIDRDMDGELRDPVNPDIGADEFTEAYYILAMKDTTICNNTQIEIDAGAGFDSYLWNTGETTQIITVDTTGVDHVYYRVTVTHNTYDYLDSVLVTFTGPEVDLGPDETYCTDGSVLLDAGAGSFTYLWSDMSTAQTLSVSTTGQYSVTITDTYGCTDADTVNITINPLPDVTIITETDALRIDDPSVVTYQWYFDNNIIDMATENIYNPVQSGDYFVFVTDGNNCSNYSDTVHFEISAFETLSGKGLIDIYPNPATGSLNIRLTGVASKVKLQLLNIVGSVVYTREINDPAHQPETRIDLNNLPEGIYFAVIQIDDRRFVRKVVKE